MATSTHKNLTILRIFGNLRFWTYWIAKEQIGFSQTSLACFAAGRFWYQLAENWVQSEHVGGGLDWLSVFVIIVQIVKSREATCSGCMHKIADVVIRKPHTKDTYIFTRLPLRLFSFLWTPHNHYLLSLGTTHNFTKNDNFVDGYKIMLFKSEKIETIEFEISLRVSRLWKILHFQSWSRKSCFELPWKSRPSVQVSRLSKKNTLTNPSSGFMLKVHTNMKYFTVSIQIVKKITISNPIFGFMLKVHTNMKDFTVSIQNVWNPTQIETVFALISGFKAFECDDCYLNKWLCFSFQNLCCMN